MHYLTLSKLIINNENIKKQNERIHRCEIKIEKNSDDIYILNSKVNSR